MTRIGLTLFVLSFVIYPAAAQMSNAASPADVARQVREYRQANEHKIISELTTFLSIPNIATDTPNIERNAVALVEMLQKRGVSTQLLPIPRRGPVVFGELKTPGATRTVIFYAHYDGQPVDPAAWTGTKPFEPALRTNSIEAGGQLIPFPAPGTPHQDDWRMYARSASDDKSPIVAILTALDALRAKQILLTVNVKFILDGEEEAGSPNLERTLAAHRDLTSGDVLITADGPVHQSGRPMVFFGNRGVMDVEITVYGPTRALHSGHYGNWAPNPAFNLARLLASMKDADGRVLIDGFYDDVEPLSDRGRQAIAEMPANDPDLMRELLINRPDGGGKKLVELINLPSLNIRGLRSAYVGAQSQNIIPTQATASLDLRLVRNIQPAKQFDRVVAHIRKQGYCVTSSDPAPDEKLKCPLIAKVTTDRWGYRASRTSMDLPVSRAIVQVVEEATGGHVVKMPTLGGSAPMFIFEQWNLPVIGVPMVNHDNNQHAADESLRLGNLWRGIEIYAALMAGLRW